MPHITVKSYPGRSEQQKQELAARITRAVMDCFGSSEESISIAIEDVPGEDWARLVFEPEIRPSMDKLYKKPGYDPA